jgi:hypothetical protein
MTEDKILWVARYVEGELSKTAHADFEKHLLSDMELQEYLKEYREVHQGLRMHLAVDEGRKALEKNLLGFNKSHFVETGPKVMAFRSYLKWASGVAAILIIGLLVWAPWRGNLYQQFAVADQMWVVERGAAEETSLDKAAALYNEKKYTEAAPLLASLYAKDPQNAMLAYYYGSSLLEIGTLGKGREVLQTLFNGESVYKYNSAYAIALSYLKEKDKENCKKWLKLIPEGTSHSIKAKQLLDKL